LGDNYGLIANPVGSINIAVNDSNYHYLTVISPSKFNDARQFAMRLTSTNNTSAVFTVNEYPGYSHVFQFKFKGNVTLWADASGGSDAIVQALFLDDASVTFSTGYTNFIQQTNLSTSTVISSSQNPAAAGSNVTFTGTVSAVVGTPTGNVSFYDGTNSLGAGNLDGAGLAVLSTALLSAGGSPHTITAVYNGDGTFAGSTSPILLEAITTTNLNTNTIFNTSSADITNGLVADYPLAANGNDAWAGNNLALAGSPAFSSGAVSWNGLLPTWGHGPNRQWPQSGLTVSSWINMIDPKGNYVVAACYENTNGSVNQSYFQFFTMSNGLTARIVQNRDVNFIGRTTLASLTPGWHFVAFTWTGGPTSSSIRIFLDGTRIDNGDQNYGTFVTPYSGSDIPFTVGAQVSPGGGFAGQFYGNQKDVRMYNRALSASEIGILYTNGANPAPVTKPVTLLPPLMLHIAAP